MNHFGNAGQFLIGTVFGLAMVVLLLRVLLQAFGANFYNPVCQFLHKATQPAVGPMRKVIPPYGRVELAGIVLVWLLAMLKFCALAWVVGQAAPPLPALLVAGLADALSLLLWVIFWTLLASVILSWIPVDNRNPVVPLIYQISEPLLRPFRRVLPDLPIDLSPILAILTVQLLRLLVVNPLFELAGRLALSAAMSTPA